MTPLRRTPLYDAHLALDGHMTPFAGWEMPLQYRATGAVQEHHAVRARAGLFDVSHMGRFTLTGAEVEAFLNHVVTIDVRRAPLWSVRYALLPNEAGGTLDDVMLYRQPESWLMVVNAANRDADLAWLRAQAAEFAVEIADVSDDTAMLAIQGPNAIMAMLPLTDIPLQTLPFHASARGMVAGVDAFVATSGYTGESGFEVILPAAQAVAVWQALLATGEVVPCGLAARDSLRLEAALPLYGHELSPEIDPYTARLGSFVHLDKAEFLGREPLATIAAQGPVRKLVGFTMTENAVPRAGYPVLINGEQVGQVTSGTKSPTLGSFIGLAIISAAHAIAGTDIQILVREKPKNAVIVKRPFYRAARDTE